jgi:outer membrane protein assembly factor BamB
VRHAFDKANGEVRWREDFPDMGFGHSTPVIIQVNDKPQLLVLASGASVKDNALRGLDPATGKPLWWCRGSGDAASPAYGSGLVYFDSGRADGCRGCSLWRCSRTHRWTVSRAGNRFATIVGRLSIGCTRPVFSNVEAATGAWYARVTGRHLHHWASRLRRAARLWLAGAGRGYLLQAGRSSRVGSRRLDDRIILAGVSWEIVGRLEECLCIEEATFGCVAMRVSWQHCFRCSAAVYECTES